MTSVNKSTAVIGLLTCLMVSMVILFSAATPALAVEKLKVVSAWAQNNKMNDALWMLQKKVKEKSNGQLELTWGGGPEAIPAFQLVEALRNGDRRAATAEGVEYEVSLVAARLDDPFE